MIGRVIAYLIAGIPAGIGIWFIADYAFATSDDGYSAAFQLGLIAATAYVMPAIALAVTNNGRRLAAFFLGCLAIGAIVANWSQTLDALANRGAGKEAEAAKLSATVKSDRARLERIERERAALPNVSAADETVKAAQAAVFAAERIRTAECEKRGPNCRTRETEEQAKRDALSKVLADKAIADKAAKLDREASEINARLVKAPAVKENSVGKTLGALLSLSAVSAATFQQQFFSAIVELAIAAFLALPELLRPRHAPTAKREEQPQFETGPQQELAPPKPRLISNQTPAVSVADYVAERIKAVKGGKLAFRDVYRDYEAAAQRRGETALDPEQFTASLAKLCEGTSVYARENQGTVYLINVRFAGMKAKTPRQQAGRRATDTA
jgi:hypothetical protein